MAQPNAKTKANGGTELPDEDLDTLTAPSGTVHETVAAGQKVQVVEAAPSKEPVAPSPGSDRTPGEPTPTQGSSDVVTLTVSPEQAEAMKLLLSQLSFVGGTAGLAAFVDQQRRAIENENTAKDQNQQALDDHAARMKEMGLTLQSAMTPEMAARELRQRDKLRAKTLGLDKTTVGGRYLQPDGKTYVNANGDVIE